MPVRDGHYILFCFHCKSHSVYFETFTISIVTISIVTIYSALSHRLICVSLTITIYIVYYIKLALLIVYFPAHTSQEIENIHNLVVSMRFHVPIDIQTFWKVMLF